MSNFKFGTRAVMLLLAISSVCMAIKPSTVLPTDALPAGGTGYIVGQFSGNGSLFGLGLKNAMLHREVIMPFFDDLNAGNDKYIANQVNMIEVVPGEYEVIYWTVFQRGTNSINFKKKFEKSKQIKIISVQPGRIACVGAFWGEEERDITSMKKGTLYTITPIAESRATFETRFKDRYVNFPVSLIDY